MRKPRLSIRRLLLIAIVALLLAGGIYAFIWLQPMRATQPALDALHTSNGVTVTDRGEWISFLPATTSTEGIIFYPGAKVDAEAYAIYMRAFAEHGYAAFIVRMPLDFAILGEGRAADVIAAYPAIHTWVIGGHSLGGVFAAQFAADHSVIKGLLLYAAYPASDMSKRTGLVVVSLYGTQDGLATPAKVNANKHLLPATTQYLAIPGGIHGYFGDYGSQPGDGQPTIPREQARQEIITDSLSIMQAVANAS